MALTPRWTKLRFHPQQNAYFRSQHRFNVNPSGRRSGKTELLKRKLVRAALRGTSFPRPRFGVGAPTRDQAKQIYWQDLKDLSPPHLVDDIREGELSILYKIGSVLRVVGMDVPARIEGQPWDGFGLDEYGNMKAGAWEANLRPALSDRLGWCDFIGVPEGMNHYADLAERARLDFAANGAAAEWGYFHWPSRDILPASEIEAARASMHPLVFQQEYGGEFVNMAGVQLFDESKLLENGQPVPPPQRCDAVFAIIDCATKTGEHNDGTACVYFAASKYAGYPLVVLDWDVQQIQGALLTAWLPTVFQRLTALSLLCGARSGSLGALIEDKDSGQVLLQHAGNMRWPARPIDSGLTALSKDARALAVSGHHYTGKVRITKDAYEKITMYKGEAANHLIRQITKFRVGDPDATKRSDDLLDAYVYGLSVALGNSEGF